MQRSWFAALAISLLIPWLPLSAHPISHLVFEVREVDGELIWVVVGNAEDAVGLTGVLPDVDVFYSDQVLQQAIDDLGRALVGGLKLRTDSGASPALEFVTAEWPRPVEAMAYERLLTVPVRWAFKLRGDPAELGLFMDLGARERGIALSAEWRLYRADGSEQRQLWRERVLYPLLLPAGAEPQIIAQPHPVVRQGFAFASTQGRRARLELLLPYLGLVDQWAYRAEDPLRLTETDRQALVAPAAAWLREAVVLQCGDRRLVPQRVAVQFFGLGADTELLGPVDAATARIGLTCEVDLPPASIHAVEDEGHWLWHRLPGSIDNVLCFWQGEVLPEPWTGGEELLVWSRPVLRLLPESLPVRSGDGPVRPWPVVLLLSVAALSLALLRRLGRQGGVVPVAFLCASVIVLPLTPTRGSLTGAQAVDITRRLHQQIYVSLSNTTDRFLYDALAQSLDRAILEQVFLDVLQGLHRAELGGPQAWVEDLRYRGFVPQVRGDGASVRCDWDLRLRLRHWGHEHRRRIRLQADIDIAARAGSWKIVGIRLLDRQRLTAAHID